MTVFITVGAPGHGKSTVAREIAKRTGAAVVAADDVRKRVVTDGDPTYSSAESAATYTRLHQAAYWIARAGRDVVMDATFKLTTGRETAAEVADAADADFQIVRVVCDAETAKERIKTRNGVSDADVSYYELFEMVPPERSHAVIDNGGELSNTRQQIAELLES